MAVGERLSKILNMTDEGQNGRYLELRYKINVIKWL